MNLFIKTGRLFYAIALCVYGMQQFYYTDFRNVFFPTWQSKLPLLPVWAYVFGMILIAVGLAIIVDKKARQACLVLGTLLLGLFCFAHVPYELLDPDSYASHLGSWTSALKELALSGGAFVMAGSYRQEDANAQGGTAYYFPPEKLILAGRIFFCITMISFGIAHFLYAPFLLSMVPSWIPNHSFWIYFAGTALIASGTFILLNIRIKTVALLLGIMVFAWFIILHIPLAIANPVANRGNELASAFDALAFSGIAFVLAGNKLRIA